MDNQKIGNLIYKLRKEKNMTQLQLAGQLNISDKAVSKWERGFGCPDVSLLPALSKVFDVDLGKLLSGELDTNEISGGNMKKMHLYVCPHCGNIMTAMTETSISCCGKNLKPLELKKAPESERLMVEEIEHDFYITANHPMEREHYISFVALLTGDTILLRKQYPQWDLQARIPMLGHAKLLWYCNQHGLFYQEV